MPEAPATPNASKTEKIPVTMNDGSVVEFNKKQKLVKTSTIADNGDVALRMDFNNGETRNIQIPTTSPLYARFVAHGAEQKLGDAIAGEDNIDDAILAVESVIGRLNAGEWTVARQGGSFSGTSILIRALVEASGKTVDEVKGFLENKSQAEKLALRRTEKLKPIIERLEAEKATKGTPVDTDALLGELGLDESASAGSGKKKAAATADA